MIKPSKLKKGDTVATISLSWGGAGDDVIIERYKLAKKRLTEDFGLKVIETEHSLKGTEFTYNNPKLRAKDLMDSVKDKNIKAIISNIGGDDSMRLLPYIDFDVIRDNPKIFMGYSDTTIGHFMFYKAGVTSFYGPAILVEFAENVKMHEYTVKSIMDMLFTSEPAGEIVESHVWTSEELPWNDIENSKIQRKLKENTGYELLQGTGVVRGELIGGCITVLDWIRGTKLCPQIEEFDGKILFLETAEDKPSPDEVKYYLRNLAYSGILDRINGIIFAKPYDEMYYEEYKEVIKKVMKEAGREDLPVLYNLNFGHTSPMMILPYGVKSEINCDDVTFSILESGVK